MHSPAQEPAARPASGPAPTVGPKQKPRLATAPHSPPAPTPPPKPTVLPEPPNPEAQPCRTRRPPGRQPLGRRPPTGPTPAPPTATPIRSHLRWTRAEGRRWPRTPEGHVPPPAPPAPPADSRSGQSAAPARHRERPPSIGWRLDRHALSPGKSHRRCQPTPGWPLPDCPRRLRPPPAARPTTHQRQPRQHQYGKPSMKLSRRTSS